MHRYEPRPLVPAAGRCLTAPFPWRPRSLARGPRLTPAPSSPPLLFLGTTFVGDGAVNER